ncbi:MAG TPA: type I-B CRISPR-associated protein Cas7/Cst2/DevR [Ruminococcus sp.]|mgnify:FL=1|nr:type I-B CRISPR-associated protein Cas7/Cst2/DevR [Ruminococcus sp.]
MNKNGLTITMIFDASSANYGEGIGNISQLKKMTRSGGEVYTYISRQAIRYNIVQQMQIDNTPVDNAQKVVQFSPNTTIKDYPEIDLFGYMKTTKGGQSIRSAVVRLSNAISLEPYKSDTDFLNNMGLAKRSGLENALAQSEIHKSLYSYTITIDLDKIGIDDDIEIENSEKSERIIKLLDTIQFLWRDIRGRRENLNPLFAVGGIYERKNPYFEDRLKLTKNGLNAGLIKSVKESCEDTQSNTVIGYVPGIFSNEEEIIKTLSPVSISEMFTKLKEEVRAYYA